MDEFGSSKTIADSVTDEILRVIDTGELAPGQRINDAELAERFGVSRTPVREALQRLRAIDMVETSASRFTRVATPGPRTVDEGKIVWAALYGAVVDEVVPGRSDSLVEEVERNHVQFEGAIASGDHAKVTSSLHACFRPLMRESGNRTLISAVEANLHLFLLAMRSVSGPAGPTQSLATMLGSTKAQSIMQDFVDGLRKADVAACRTAVARTLD